MVLDMKSLNLLAKIEPKSAGQMEMLKALKSDAEIVGLFGPTGTGKSLFSIVYGITATINGDYSRLLICKPIVDVVTGREYTAVEVGALYYDLAKAYLIDILSGITDWGSIEELFGKGKIMLVDTHYLRGRTFDNSIIFLDDVQAVPLESCLEVLMRLGSNSRLIIAGDPIFQKTGIEKDSATILREILLGEEDARVVDLGVKDVIRPGARRGLKFVFEARVRKRTLTELESKIMDSARIYAPDADMLTIISLVEEKKAYEITSPHTPDALIIVKEGHMGRIVGKGGERIRSIEEETELRLRAVELTLDFTEFIRAIHPVAWVYKHLVDADFAGPLIEFKIKSEAFGPFVGQKGFHIKFIDSVFRKLIGVGAAAVEVTVKEEARRARRKS